MELNIAHPCNSEIWHFSVAGTVIMEIVINVSVFRTFMDWLCNLLPILLSEGNVDI